MIKTETFRQQLMNSVIRHTTSECTNLPEYDYMQFMMRSELQRRHRELMVFLADSEKVTTSTAEKTLHATAIMFFNGDVQACTEQWEAATIDDPDACYEVEMLNLGKSCITAIDLTTDIRRSV